MKWLTRSVWFLTIFFAMPATLLTWFWGADAFAQATPPTPTLPAISASTMTALVLPLVLGVVNQLVQSGKLFGQWTIAVSSLPYLTVFGSFLTGAIAYLSGVGWAITGATIIYAVGAGIAALVVGTAPGVAVRHLGGEIKKGNGASPGVLIQSTPAQKGTSS